MLRNLKRQESQTYLGVDYSVYMEISRQISVFNLPIVKIKEFIPVVTIQDWVFP